MPPQLKVEWSPLQRSSIRHTWSWRDDIRQQVVNTDIDGLLTAALLHHLKGWPVAGFYDTETLWLSDHAGVPLDMPSTLWVDVDMCWPGSRSLSQHVVTTAPGLAGKVDAHAETVNPNQAVGCHGGSFSVYRYKYPYGTFQWTAWMAGQPPAPNPADPLMTGLAWMADGGFKSVNHPLWRENCLAWATRTLPGSLLEPLARHGTVGAGGLVEGAARHLARERVLPRSWRNSQYVMSQRRGALPVVDPGTAAGADDVQQVLDGITGAYGWRRLQVEPMKRRFGGTWKTASTPPPGWPTSANDGRIVSMAITGNREYCWTEPDNDRGLAPLRDALG